MTGFGYQIGEEDFLRIGKILRAKARSFGISDADVEDLLQETFLHAQDGLDRGMFQGTSQLDTWVVGIGKHRFANYLRAKNTEKRKALEISIDQSPATAKGASFRVRAPGPERTAEAREQLRRVLKSIYNLPEKLRQPLVLFAQGREYKEIASILGITTDLVTSRLHEGRAKLRQLHARAKPRSKT